MLDALFSKAPIKRHILRLASSLMLTILVAASACSEQAADPAPIESGPLAIEVSSGDLVPAFSPEILDYELSAYTTLAPVLLTVRGASAQIGETKWLDGEPAALPTLAIRPDSVIPIEVMRGSERTTYRLHLSPRELPQYTFQADGAVPKELFLAPFSWTEQIPSYLLVLDAEGEVQYYRKLTAPGLDFKRIKLPDGQIRHTFLSAGAANVLGPSFETLGSHQLVATAQHPSYPADIHDVVMLADDHFILMSYVDKVVHNVPEALLPAPGGARVIAAVVQELQAGAVVAEWDSTDHPELYTLSTDGNAFSDTQAAADYAHLNSIEVDPSDGGWILSFRHLDAILKVAPHSGKILWRLGGAGDSFATPEPQRPSHQHFARLLADGRLQVFDNGNRDQASRVLAYGLDPAKGQLSSFDSLPIDAFSQAMGSAQAVGSGSTLIGLGAHRAGEPDVLEIERATGKHRFQLTFTANYYSYRAQKAE